MILEVGCGVGNFIFPLLQELDKIFFYACDFSKRAVQFVKVIYSYLPIVLTCTRGGSRGGGCTRHVPPPKIGKNMIFFA